MAYTSIDGLKEDSRAWVAPVEPGFISPLVNGNPIEFFIRFDNRGKSPATDVHYQYDKTTKFIDNNSLIENILSAKIVCEGVTTAEEGDVIYQGINKEAFKLTTSTDSKDYIQFMAGQKTLLIQMCVTYNSLKETRHSAFCYYHRGGAESANAGFNKCGKGNFAD